MASGQLLVARYRQHLDRAFDAAVKDTAVRMQTKGRAPRRSGQLRTGIKVTRTGGRAVYTAEMRSTARNAGFDYPQYIDRVARIAPTRARMLSWVDSLSGRRVFSRGFRNPNRGWWKKTTADAKREWRSALSAALQADGLR